MLIVALVLAVVSLAALVTAVVTSNEAIAWVCIGFSALGVLLLIVDAIRDRHRRPVAPAEPASDLTEVAAGVGATEVIAPVGAEGDVDFDEDELPAGVPSEGELAEDEVPDEEYPDEQDFAAELEDHPEETVHDEPDYDMPSDDEPSYPVPAEEAAVHIVGETGSDADSAAPVSYESSPDTDHSITVIYSGEPYTGESSTVTESYIVITDEPDIVAGGDESVTVIYADETGVPDAGAGETEGSEERGSDSGR